MHEKAKNLGEFLYSLGKWVVNAKADRLARWRCREGKNIYAFK